MRMNARGLLHLKPFDETDDKESAGAVYARTRLLAVGVVASAALALLSAVLGVVRSPAALPILGAAISVSSITAGLEWHAGLKARALNQLFVTLVCTLAIVVVSRL